MEHEIYVNYINTAHLKFNRKNFTKNSFYRPLTFNQTFIIRKLLVPELNFLLLFQQNGNNYLGREWWFFIFRYFEQNVKGNSTILNHSRTYFNHYLILGPIPNGFSWPITIPHRYLHAKLPNRES